MNAKIKFYLDQIAEQSQAIETTEKEMTQLVCLGVKAGQTPGDISEGIQAGRDLLRMQWRDLLRMQWRDLISSQNELAALLKAHKSISDASFNASSYEYKNAIPPSRNTTPQQDYDSQEMAAIAGNYTVSYLVEAPKHAA